jgi:Na+/H+ antiporter NhaD/arsenite permease-like protein
MQPTHMAAPGLIWGAPFAGVLLCIALMPMIAPRLWHRRMGAAALAWIAALLVPTGLEQGFPRAAAVAWHAILLEYLPFCTLLLALFTVGGGILLRGGPWGAPAGNTLLLAAGTLLAGVLGTTGAAMVLIHPLLRANADRDRKAHLVVFFILLVGNAGGALSPLGDPPLFVGFLRGVPFFWPLLNLHAPLLVVAGLLLAAFYVVDRRLSATDPAAPSRESLSVRGWGNVALLGVVTGSVLLTGAWHPGKVAILGASIGAEQLVGMGLMLAACAASLRTTPPQVRRENLFGWAPMLEIGKLFAAIFITIQPVLQMLHEGASGPLAGVLSLAADPAGHPRPLAYFWLTGVASGFLDNAPTYLAFYELAGGDAQQMTGPLNRTLTALASGAVFFGGLTYIGNAPNLMVRSIASRRGVQMPGFFGYILWSSALLLPVFAVVSALFFL